MGFVSTSNVATDGLFVLHELGKTLPLDLPVEYPDLDAHERAVMDALDSILRGTHALDNVDPNAVRFSIEDQTILQIALALHDVGRRSDPSDPRADASDSHAETGYLLLNRNHVALRGAIQRHCQKHDAPPATTDEESLRMILWLVRHHEVLQELFRGERLAVDVDRIAALLCQQCKRCVSYKRCRECQRTMSRAIRLLFVVSVCDSLGRFAQDAVQPRADFWRKVIETHDRTRFGDLSHRLAQWTCDGPNGCAYGSPGNKIEASALWTQLKPATRDVFSSRIGHVVGGSELMHALSPRMKARLLNAIAHHYTHHFDTEEVTLSFAQPYDPKAPEAAELLSQYETVVQNHTLTSSVNVDKRQMCIACPTGKR